VNRCHENTRSGPKSTARETESGNRIHLETRLGSVDPEVRHRGKADHDASPVARRRRQAEQTERELVNSGELGQAAAETTGAEDATE